MQLWQPITEKTRKVATNVSAWTVEAVPKTTVSEPRYVDRVSAHVAYHADAGVTLNLRIRAEILSSGIVKVTYASILLVPPGYIVGLAKRSSPVAAGCSL